MMALHVVKLKMNALAYRKVLICYKGVCGMCTRLYISILCMLQITKVGETSSEGPETVAG